MKQSNPIKFDDPINQFLIWWSKALDVDNTGHIDKELLTQIFTEEGEAFSEVDDFLLTKKKCASSSATFFLYRVIFLTGPPQFQYQKENCHSANHSLSY